MATQPASTSPTWAPALTMSPVFDMEQKIQLLHAVLTAAIQGTKILWSATDSKLPTTDIESVLAEIQQLRKILQPLDPRTTHGSTLPGSPLTLKPTKPPSQRMLAPPRPSAPQQSHANGLSPPPFDPTKTIHPNVLCKAINKALKGGPLTKTIPPLLGTTDPTEAFFYLADPWHKVVFYKVPLLKLGVLPTFHDFTFHDFIDEVESWNMLPGTEYRIGNVHFLHPQDKVPQVDVSVRVNFIGEADALCFLRDGIFLFGSHCRASLSGFTVQTVNDEWQTASWG
ncbi:hypothetical protein B0H10DRAFT_1954746 [Mycena sp. CBHHK59/15]|nr:hypothetical protein B0H10DRAFT_1954746 [Mycena sp. CBHHK59/15]